MEADEKSPRNSPERMLAVLDLFEGQAMEWTMEDMAGRLGYTRSTLYRYLKSLTEAGLLSSLPGVGYTLGPRIVELDFAMRSRDPLIVAGRPIMAELAREHSGVALLCRRYRERVLCVHQEQNASGFVSTYERGRARSLLRGAASRVILAHLPPSAIRRVLDAQAPRELVAAGLGQTVDEARVRLRAIRQRGWDVTSGDVTPGLTGIAAPMLDQTRQVLGSLSLTMGGRLGDEKVTQLAAQITFCANVLSRAASRAASLGEEREGAAV